jgi:predicted HAD superfamily Cof-like phosphohydrolase
MKKIITQQELYNLVLDTPNDLHLGQKLRHLLFNSEIESANYYINQSDTFNKAFGVDKGREIPTIPELKEASFYKDMLQEEVDELDVAIKDGDIVEIADALCDIQVFLANAVLGFGLQYKFKQMMDEVFTSNMSKLCKTEEEAIETVRVRTKEALQEHFYEKIGDNYAVRYKGNGKVRKSVNFREPNLKKILES